MSAFCSLLHEDRVELLTDGAIYRPDGTLVAIREKVWRSASTPLAVTGRGDAGMVARIAAAILVLSACGDFDRTMMLVMDMLDRHSERGIPEPVEMLICGVSPSDGPRQAYFVTGEVYEGVRPWTLTDPGRHLCGAVSDDVLSVEIDEEDPTLEANGLRIFEALRSQKGVNPLWPDLPPIHGIGGHIDLTTITAAGATTRRLHTWPDVIGETIQPNRRAQAEAA